MYSVIYAEGGWDHGLDEPRLGGRCLCEVGTLAEAARWGRVWAGRAAWRRGHPWLAWLCGHDAWPDGEVVVTGPGHGWVAAFREGREALIDVA